MHPAATAALTIVAVAGTLYTLQRLTGEIMMEGQHWIMLVIILAVGYVIGRMWATPAQLVGLP